MDRAWDFRRDSGAPIPTLVPIEEARLLAERSRPFLNGCGLTDRDIRERAETYIARMGSGNVKSFVEWINLRQRVREVT